MGLSSIPHWDSHFLTHSLLSVADPPPPPRVHFHNLNMAYNGLKQLYIFKVVSQKYSNFIHYDNMD